ncbi:VOC family protein [Bacillus sp. FJAT-49731]|uniref:VOC family protein n=1 Tax=Lederbergia citrea TaxID=2833581 RepID=A0A942UNQ3_9BACI|nr:VOC family protein [Lederbergia citrea]MBS4203077.1 VOC family protein [Lederbergia citrea]MBS4222251.1 VOC family protein [Lederbergia citrea]
MHQKILGKIKGASIVFLVSDIKKSSEFYRDVLGFDYEEIGIGNIKHIHLTRDNLTFILHEAGKSVDIRPFSSLFGGPQWDAFAYSDSVDLLFEEFKAKGVEIAYGFNQDPKWNEFAIKDVDGYVIAFGGGLSNNRSNSYNL